MVILKVLVCPLLIQPALKRLDRGSIYEVHTKNEKKPDVKLLSVHTKRERKNRRKLLSVHTKREKNPT